MVKHMIIAVIAVLLLTVPVRSEWEFTKDFTRSADNIKKVFIDSPSGEIKFEPSSDGNISVVAKTIVYLKGEDDAKKVADDCEIDFKVVNSTIEVIVDFPQTPRRHQSFRLFSGQYDRDLEVLIKVSVPREISLIVETSSADITAIDLHNDLTVDGSSSDVSLENVKGNCDLSLSSGDLEAYVVEGSVFLYGSSSDFLLEDVTGDLDITTSSGDIIVEKVLGNLKLTTSSGDVRISALDGDLTCKASSGDVICDDVKGSVEVKSSSGDVRLRRLSDADGNFFVRTTSGDAYIEVSSGFDGSFEVETASGSINTSVDMTVRSYSDSYLRGTTGEGPGKIQVMTTSGDVELESF